MRRTYPVFLLLLLFGCQGTSSIENGGEGPNNVSTNNQVDPNNTTLNNSVSQNNSTTNNSFVDPNNMVELPEGCEAADGADIYERRIEPLVAGGPSSCNQCHLKGVDLAMFVQDTPCQSMACLDTLELVDLEQPENSSILEQIMLAEPDELITDEVIQAEYDGFLAWISWSSTCHDAVCGDIAEPCNSGTGEPTGNVLTPLGQCSEQEVGTAFMNLVYSGRERCAGCHNPSGPRFEDGTAWLDMGDDQYQAALRTMYALVGIGAVNVETPESSILLLKPLAESEGGVPHTGGIKFPNKQDSSYRAYLDWLNLYAECYETGNVGTLPQEPYVAILNGDDRTVSSSEDYNLNGEALDAQDGLLVPRWSSDLDGDLGSGSAVMNPNLSVGTHTLTLTATDSDGNTATSSKTIIVN